jgi:putative membrane protein
VTTSQSPGSSRRPRRVYGAGHEPEARDSLANERTFLAWVRTSLALVAGAVAVSSPALEFSVAARLLLSLGLVSVAGVALGVGWHRWTRTETALRTNSDLPGFTGGIVVLAAIGLLMAGALVSTLVGH